MFPSIITSFPTSTPTSRLNSPSHSALHNLETSTIGQIEAVIGLAGDSSVLGTIIGDLRSPDSNGGGHIQTANKGGTGQTTYSKGDLLVATSQSVISKLGVSSNAGYVLVADPNQSPGMKWSPVISNKIVINTSSVAYTGSIASAQPNVLFAASILGSIIGDFNAIKFTGVIQNFSANSAFNLKVNYGVNSLVTLGIINQSSVFGTSGLITGEIVGSGPSSQLGFVSMNTINNSFGTPQIRGLMMAGGLTQGNSSVNASASQDLVITGQFTSFQGQNSILTGIFTVEKIA